jgi:hypothetical protein
MVKRILSAFFILIFSWPSVATKIEGKNKEYAGKKLDFFRFSDPVTQEKIHVFSLEADREGNFSTDVKVDQTTFVICDFGIYRGMLFWSRKKTVDLCCHRSAKNRLPTVKILISNQLNFGFQQKKEIS